MRRAKSKRWTVRNPACPSNADAVKRQRTIRKRNGTATLFAALNAANGEVFAYAKNGIVTRNGSNFYA
jgi:hypothetical protein